MKKNLLSLALCSLSFCAYSQLWMSLGSGSANGVNSNVSALAVDTVANELYVGGDFTTAGGVSANYVAKWNGTSWTSLGAGTNGSVYAICYYKGEIYVGGQFTMAGSGMARNIAKWNGSTWSQVGNGLNSAVYSLCVYKGDLYAGGVFTAPGSGTGTLKRIVKWDGSTFTQVGAGVDNGYISALKVFGTDLFIGGKNCQVNSVNQGSILKWNGTTLSSAGGTTNNVQVNMFCVHQGELYSTGIIISSNTKPAKWNGSAWTELSAGIGQAGIYGIESYNWKLYIGCNSNAMPAVFTWTGSSWNSSNGGISYTGGVISPLAYTFVIYKNELILGGAFKYVGPSSSVNANYVARWNDGTTMISANEKLSAAIAPNPTSGLLTLSLSQGNINDYPVTLTDLSGRELNLVSDIGMDERSMKIDMGGLEKGIYLITVQTPGGFVTRKVVKD